MSAPFRIRKQDRVRSSREDTNPNQGFKEYLERLLKLIPGEIVGLYLIGNGFIPASEKLVQMIWIGVTFLLLIIIRVWGTADKKEKLSPQFKSVLIAAVSFLLWVYSLGGPFISYKLHYPMWASLAILVWTFLIPSIYKGSP